jgi:retinoblastoma-like protein 1
VDIITFYNEIFIPAAKPLLVDVGSAGTTVKASNVPEVGNNKDGIVFFLKKTFLYL